MRLAHSVVTPFTSKVVDSLFVGETENIGNPRTDAEKAYGRSLPKPEMPDFPIRGYEYYDYRHDVENVTFRNYEDNATRKTGAISNLMYSSFGVSTNNAFERVKFVNAKPVYFPPMERKWGSDNGGSTSYRTAAFRDKDGSLGGGPNSYILIHDGVNDSIAVDAEACEIKPTWNAAVCKGDVGRMNFGGGGGGAASWRWCPGAGVPVPAQRRRVPAPRSRRAGCSRSWRAALVRRCRRSWRGCRCWRTWWSSRRSRWSRCSAASRSQPQWQGVHRNRGTNVRAGTEIKVTTERPSVSLTLTELDRGSWVIFELPGFTTAASGAPQNSLDALRRPAPPRTTRARIRSGSRLSPPVTPAPAPLVVEPASRSAGKLAPCCMSKSPRRRPGAFFVRHLRGRRAVSCAYSTSSVRARRNSDGIVLLRLGERTEWSRG